MLEKKYDFRAAEKSVQKLWADKDVYRFDPESPNQIYSIDTPPPTVSGSLHIGHIFSYTQAEMVARYRKFMGYNVFYPFGFDDNGLPTERLVEKEEGIKAKDLSREELYTKCMSTTAKYVDEFTNLWKSLGFSVDWNLRYETIDERSRRISQKSFIRLAKEGKAYVKESPVLWCTECQTSIAQAELDSADIKSTFNYIYFMVDGKPLTVATTRPELLYGVVCLFVNPEDERYKEYVGKKAVVPVFNYEVPILTDEIVSLEKGTGVVMCATYGDQTDVDWCEKHNLPYRKVITTEGRIDESVPYVAGMSVYGARKELVRMMEEQGLLEKVEDIVHPVQTHERCGKPIEILPSRQWYIDILSHKELFVEAGKKINWYPTFMKSRYDVWVENLKWDWCISRQRYFGVPFPVWYCKKCGKPMFADESILPVNPLEFTPEATCECGCNEWIPESSVLDTWATSSMTPQINAHWEEPDGTDLSDKLAPMTMRTQAHEIIRTWAFYTIAKSMYHTGNIPWQDIMVCGFVLAKKGEKISKSKGNAVKSPAQLVEEFGADCIRYWAANTKLGTDTYFSDDELKIANRFLTKLWNASKFTLTHLEDYSKEDAPEELLPVDKWIVERCKQTMRRCIKLLDEYEIGSARHEIDDFFWKDFCDYYVEISKERLYQPEVHGYEARRSGQYAIYYCLLNILKMYGIFVPHMTEFIYQDAFKDKEGIESLHLNFWKVDGEDDAESLEFGELVKDAVSEVRKYKSENNISMKADIDSMTIKTPEKFKEDFDKTLGDIVACCHAQKVEFEIL